MFFSKNKNRLGCDNSGFTLPELLIVIAIISVLATMALGVLRQAQVEARVSATEARITQIEAIFQLKLEDYEVRRLPIRLGELLNYVRANPLNPAPAEPVGDAVRVRNLKRRILADIINAELPNPTGSGVGVFPTTVAPFDATSDYDDGFATWLDNTYPDPAFSGGPTLRQRLQALTPATIIRWNALSTFANFDNSGEYLYEILRTTDVDGQSALELLGNSAVGDFDGDGIKEVVDSFGVPLQLRVLQVDAAEDDIVGSELWLDSPVVPTVWTNPDPVTRIPQGYKLLNSTISREIQQIRFQVVSTSPEMGI